MSRSALQAVFLLCGTLGTSAPADEAPLHQRIDELILPGEIGPIAGEADDATFLRRISLDLIGRVPTREEVEAFLADAAPDKRERVIDRLLASPEYPRHMAVVFDLMLMERRGDKHVKSVDFRRYLEEAFADNRSYLAIVREILSADGTDEKIRPAAAFYLEREVEPHLLTRDVGRIFFGIDLQCAQCHNHPLIDDYYQPDYYGLHAFFVRSSLFQADKKKPALVAEQATGEADFLSVFTDREGMIRPRVPGGDELLEVTLKPTEQYHVAPGKNVRPVPTLSRMAQLAEVVVETPSPAFNRNIVNRLWAHMFGRGLVHPVDLHHSANPPTHPEVLELLAKEFVESNYDVKRLLRELALTTVYQRSFRLPPLKPAIEDAHRRIEAAQQTAETASARAAAAEEELDSLIEKLDAAVAVAKPWREAEATANKQVAAALKPRDEAQAKVTARQRVIAQRESQAELLNQSVEKTTAAVEALQDDKELAAALATIEKRQAAHAGDLQKLQQTLSSEQKKLAAAEETLQSASNAADEAIAARVPHEQTVRALRRDVFAARDQAQTLRTQASIARRDVTYLETLLSYAQSLRQIAQLKAAIGGREQSIASKADRIAAAKQQVQTTHSAADEARTAVTGQHKKLAAATATLEPVQQTQSQLAKSIASAESALQTLPGDEQVIRAVALLKESLTDVDAEVKEALAVAAGEQQTLNALQETLTSAVQTWNASKQARAALEEDAAMLKQTLSDDRQSMASAQATLETTWGTLVDQSAARGNAAGLTALTPEQFALSLLTVTGQYERQRAAETAKLDKEQPLPAESAEDRVVLADRQRVIDEAAYMSLSGTIATFVKLYGAATGQPQQEFFATAEQSLFAANGNEIRAWLRPAEENLTSRLVNTENVAEAARELYVSILSRPPTPEEIADVANSLTSRPDQKQEAVQELAWGLITSAEFRFRH